MDQGRTVVLIAAVDEAGGLARHNVIPWNVPQDRAWFKALTSGHTLILGRKTFDAMQRRALPNRRIIVLSRSLPLNAIPFSEDAFLSHDVTWANDPLAALHCAQKHDACVFIGGGAEVYKVFLLQATHIALSLIPGNFACDTYFPRFEQAFVRTHSALCDGFTFFLFQKSSLEQFDSDFSSVVQTLLANRFQIGVN